MDASDDDNDSRAAPSAAAGAAAFTITTELALSSDISIACWCPTMDLCAVVSADGQLHLHRMDWQLLWAVSPEALVTAVTWRPDGKEIAAGHANGAISILDVETGKCCVMYSLCCFRATSAFKMCMPVGLSVCRCSCMSGQCSACVQLARNCAILSNCFAVERIATSFTNKMYTWCVVQARLYQST
jgi:WD40 repeat protein